MRRVVGRGVGGSCTEGSGRACSACVQAPVGSHADKDVDVAKRHSTRRLKLAVLVAVLLGCLLHQLLLGSQLREVSGVWWVGVRGAACKLGYCRYE